MTTREKLAFARGMLFVIKFLRSRGDIHDEKRQFKRLADLIELKFAVELGPLYK